MLLLKSLRPIISLPSTTTLSSSSHRLLRLHHPSVLNNKLLLPFSRQFSFWPFDKKWSRTLLTPGFKRDEIKIETIPDSNLIKVHALQKQPQQQPGEEDEQSPAENAADEEDYSEIKKTIHIPKDVDLKDLKIEFDHRGFLTFHAPYKNVVDVADDDRVDKLSLYDLDNHSIDILNHQFPWNSFGLIEQELKLMRQEMNSLIKNCFTESAVRSEFVKENDNGKSFIKWDFNLHGYKPEEITIRQFGDVVSVEAKHENKEKHKFRQFKQIFTLPDNVVVDELKSTILKNGHLQLIAPCLAHSEGKQVKEITPEHEEEKSSGGKQSKSST